MATLNLAVGASTDDAYERNDGSAFAAAGVVIDCDSGTTDNARKMFGGRWLNVTIAPGSTIDATDWAPDVPTTARDDPTLTIYGDDVDDAPTFTSGAGSPETRVNGTPTTATVSWVATGVGTGFSSSPDIKAIVQEIIDRGGWASGQDIALICRGNNAALTNFRITSWDGDNAKGAQLNITYTVGGGGGDGTDMPWIDLGVAAVSPIQVVSY